MLNFKFLCLILLLQCMIMLSTSTSIRREEAKVTNSNTLVAHNNNNNNNYNEAEKKAAQKAALKVAKKKDEKKMVTEKEEEALNEKVIVTDNESALSGSDFLEGIREIIGRDGLLSSNDLQYKPFMGSFANIKSDTDPMLKETAYCMTDNHCGHFEAYSESGVPLSDLACNKFCYIDSNTKYYATSQVYTIDNPPETYLCCGWETCG